jgi:hypothetical protein
VGPTWSERWAKYVVTKSRQWYPWMFWAFAAVLIGFSILDWVDGDRAGVRVLGLLACMMFLVGFVWWERLGFRRLLEAKDDEIKRLQGVTTAPDHDRPLGFIVAPVVPIPPLGQAIRHDTKRHPRPPSVR